MSQVNKKLAKVLAAAAETPKADTPKTVKPSSKEKTKTSPTSPTLSLTPTCATKSPTKIAKGLPGYLLGYVDDGSGDPAWSKSGSISSLEALRDLDVNSASTQDLINIVVFKRLFKNLFQDFSRDYLRATDSLLRTQVNDQGNKLISKSHPKAVDRSEERRVGKECRL